MTLDTGGTASAFGDFRFGDGLFGLHQPDYHPLSDLFRNVQPWYQQSNYITQMFWAWQGELDQFNRWTQWESSPTLYNVLFGNWLFQHEGILAAWLARETYDPFMSWWEYMLGIPTDTSLDNTYRRNYILQKMQQVGQSPTPQYIEAQAEKFVDQVSVVPNIPNYSFQVWVLAPRGYIPPQVISNMNVAIDAVKPAHLGYNINISEADWALLQNDDWNHLQNIDWINLGSV